MASNLAAIPSNGWHHLNDSDTVFVFVHGFMSTSFGCWTYKEPKNNEHQVFWPDMVLSDTRLGTPSVYLGGYYTSHDSRDYSIADCATELFASLQRIDTDHRPAPMSKQNILFVCHSLGGIVTRYMLTEHVEYFAKKHVGLVLLASPSLGSGLANLAQKFCSGYGNEILSQLKHQAPLLEELDRKFSAFIRTNKLPKLVGIEAYENQPAVGIWPFSKLLGKVVEKNSAGRYFESRNMHGTNHGSIAKPSDLDHPTHKCLVDFYSTLFTPMLTPQLLRPLQNHIENAPSSNSPRKAPNGREVLFSHYIPERETYFLARDIDSKIEALLGIAGLWISGPSGVGKTCSATRAIHRTSAKFLYINLANCMGNTVTRMFSEILDSIQTNFQQKKTASDTKDLTTTISQITASLDLGLTNGVFYIFIEEIPLDDTPSFAEFITAILSLLVSCAATRNGTKVRFIFSTIASPKPHIPAAQSKIFEIVKFVDFVEWSEPEIVNLLMHLCNYLETRFDSEFEKEIVRSARGSPRFIKTFLLNCLVASQCRKQSYQTVLAETLRELGV